jgi:hypothetical protein
VADIRMSLADAAKALGVAPNSVRSRFKAGKLRGERDNQGKIWVWLDNADLMTKPSKSKLSKASIEGSNDAHVNALEAHLRTVTEQLSAAQRELASLRFKASDADRLAAQVTGLEALRDEVRADRDRWRDMAERALDDLHKVARPRGLWSRLFGR